MRAHSCEETSRVTMTIRWTRFAKNGDLSSFIRVFFGSLQANMWKKYEKLGFKAQTKQYSAVWKNQAYEEK